jgi:selenocysteine lyase/cysteine desulfurase
MTLPGPAALDQMLISGGDTRLRLNADTQLNEYGCQSCPRPSALSFSSSTASTISQRAYAAAERAFETLQASERADAFDVLVEEIRAELKDLWQLPADVDVVFAPSGTDAELRALYLAQCVLPAPVVSIVVGADETGSGMPLASAGRHFNDATANGRRAIKGRRILGLANKLDSIRIPSLGGDGQVRALDAIDADVLRSTQDATTRGCGVALNVITHSKLGTHAPSTGCVARIRETFGDRVQVIIDACQARASRAQINAELAHDSIVLITGSKFFTGPAFSGALFVPPAVSARAVSADHVPEGFADYTNASDWPAAYARLRAALPQKNNIGQALRWVAALEEMRRYFNVPAHFRSYACAEFSQFAEWLIHGTPNFVLLNQPDCDLAAADEFTARTVFPFVMKRNGRLCSVAEAKALYHALNQDLARIVHAAPRDRRQLLGRLCHIGQPVTVPQPSGEPAGALRIASDARMIAESWLSSPDAAARRFQSRLEDLRIVFDKLQFLIDHYETIAHGQAA